MLTSDNDEVASALSVIVLGAIVALAGFVVYLLVLRFGRPGWWSLTFVSVAIVAFWHGVGGGWNIPLPSWLVQVSAIVVIGIAAGRLADHRFTRLGLFAVSLTLVAVIGGLAIPRGESGDPVVEVVQPAGSFDFETRPDIYLVVLDGYGRSDVIREYFGHDISEFEKELEVRGFDVLDRARTNYPVTHFAIPALLNMSYMHRNEGPINGSDLRLLAEHIGGANDVVRTVKENGYRYVHGEGVTPYNRCGHHVDVCLRGPLPDLSAFRVLEETVVGDLMGETHPNTELNLLRIEQMTQWPAPLPDGGDEPTFTFLHLILPHPPLFLDENCDARFGPAYDGVILTDGNLTAERLQVRRAAWVQQVRCANRVTLAFLENLSSEAVVVLTSDHGPDSTYSLYGDITDYTAEEIGERIPSFTAVRLPTCEDMTPEDVTLVNVFRYVFACLSNEAPDPLPDKVFLASFGGYVLEIK